LKIYVGNLHFGTTSGDLSTAFAHYGNVSGAEIMTLRDTGRSQGFGFVDMAIEAEARKAISSLDGSVLNGRTIDVSEARPATGGPGRHDAWR
jgi:RNA recognition motif-containing protein